MDPDARRRVTITQGSFPSPKPSKFSVYRNPALAAASTANSLRPWKSVILFILLLSVASALDLISLVVEKKWWINALTCEKLSPKAVHVIVKAWQELLTWLCIGVMIALCNGIYLHISKFAAGANRQLELVGIKRKTDKAVRKEHRSIRRQLRSVNL